MILEHVYEGLVVYLSTEDFQRIFTPSENHQETISCESQEISLEDADEMGEVLWNASF